MIKFPTFEKYLEEQCDYTGVLDDDYEDCLDSWLSNLDTSEVIDYAQDWGDILLKEITN